MRAFAVLLGLFFTIATPSLWAQTPNVQSATVSQTSSPALFVAAEFATVLIERIEVIGNEKTSLDVIMRRIDIRIGALLDDRAVEDARLRLLATGFFKSVEFRLRRGSQRGRVILVLALVERNTILIDGLYYGHSELEAFVGGLSVHESNLFGEGISAGLGLLIGQERQAAEIDIFVPDLSGTRLQLSASGIYVRAAEPLAGLRADRIDLSYLRYGSRIGVGFGVGAAQRVVLDYRLETIHADRLPNLHPSALRSAPSILFDDSVLSSLSLTYELDTRDDSFVPRLGSHFLFSVETGTQLLGSSYEFTKYFLELQRAIPIVADHSIVATAFCGLVQGSTPFFNQFFLRDHMAFVSGSEALPRALQVNYSTDTDYDDLLGQISVDYNLPLQSGGEFLFQSFLFFGIDFAASASLNEHQEDLRGRGTGERFPLAADLGLRLDTLIGRFTLSVAYITDLIW
jgi:outer membrane protein insertion porin family